MNSNPVMFFHQHLGRFIDPEATPSQSVASPKAPIVTNKVIAARQKDPSAPGIKDRVGAGVAAYYAITEDHAWLISQAEIPATPHVTQLSLKHPDGKSHINGMSWLAHWLARDAPESRPFMIGALENPNPLRTLRLSLPPHHVHYSHGSFGRYGAITLSLTKYRQGIAVIEENQLDWDQLKKAIRLKEQVWMASQGRVSHPDRVKEKARAEMAKIQKKVPNILGLVKKTGMSANSGEEAMMSTYFNKKCERGIVIHP